jgi:hypothetical protein
LLEFLGPYSRTEPKSVKVITMGIKWYEKWPRKNDAGDIGNSKKTKTAGYTPSRKIVLAAGLFYLCVIVFGIIAQITRMGLIESDDATATVDNIIASGGMLELAFASDIMSQTCFILLGLTCYLIFRKVNNLGAVVMLLFVVIAGTYAFVNMHHILDAIQLVSGADPLADEVLAHLNMHEDGSVLAQIIGWGPWLIPLGYLGFKSDFFPKKIGMILMIGGIGLTVQGFQYFLLPSMDDLFTPVIVLSMIAEFSTCGWFLYRGVKGFDAMAEKETRTDPCDTNSPL